MGVVCSCKCWHVLPVSIDNHRLVYCKVFCIWRHVNSVAHPVFSLYFRKSTLYFLFLALLFFLKKIFLCSALLVYIGHSHSILQYRPRKHSQIFNMRRFVASTQAFVAKAGISWEHWYSYIERRCASC